MKTAPLRPPMPLPGMPCLGMEMAGCLRSAVSIDPLNCYHIFYCIISASILKPCQLRDGLQGKGQRMNRLQRVVWERLAKTEKYLA